MRTSSTGRLGFTLVEMTVVIVLITVLSGMIAPRLWGQFGGLNIRESARGFVVTAQYAREYATTHRCDCRVVINREDGSYQVTAQREPLKYPSRFEPVMYNGMARKGRLATGVKFGKIRVQPGRRMQNDPSKNFIQFLPDGQSDAAVVEMTNSRRTLSVVITPGTARAELREGSVASLVKDRKDLDE